MGYGWRGRIGLLVPSSNTTMEAEFWRMVPEGVSVHVARMRLTEHTVEGNIEMEKDSVKAAKDLVTANVNVIVYGCTSGSFIGGPKWEEDLTQRLQRETCLPVVTTSRAVVNALRTFNAEKIVVATPYPEEINQKEHEFLEALGFKVLRMKGLNIVENIKVGQQTPDVAYKLAKEAFTEEADAIFISCTNFRTIDIIDLLEEDLCKPVVTSTQASMWAALKELKIKKSFTKYGKLLREYL
jgi:maleate isomerase